MMEVPRLLGPLPRQRLGQKPVAVRAEGEKVENIGKYIFVFFGRGVGFKVFWELGVQGLDFGVQGWG